MRKKSHILLAQYLATNMSTMELQSHRKAFCLGSILPDLKPSFLTTKHEFSGTFEALKERISDLTVNCDLQGRNARVYCRRLGEVIHYVADYFTFPHNHTYEGTLLEHGQYEKHLKNTLKTYILSGEADVHAKTNIKFKGLQELTDYIKQSHETYLLRVRNVADDIQFIMNICWQVVQGIVCLLQEKMNQGSLREVLSF